MRVRLTPSAQFDNLRKRYRIHFEHMAQNPELFGRIRFSPEDLPQPDRTGPIRIFISQEASDVAAADPIPVMATEVDIESLRDTLRGSYTRQNRVERITLESGDPTLYIQPVITRTVNSENDVAVSLSTAGVSSRDSSEDISGYGAVVGLDYLIFVPPWKRESMGNVRFIYIDELGRRDLTMPRTTLSPAIRGAQDLASQIRITR
jgi:hypothetical protein